MEIKELKDCPQFIDACASWAFGEWGTQNGGQLERTLTRFSESAQLPGFARQDPFLTTLVALEQNCPIGMISLFEHDLKGYSHLSPWIASVYVHPDYRQGGVASQLLQRMTTYAKQLDIPTLYLHSRTARDLYEKHGWKEIENILSDKGPISLMIKHLND